MSRQVVGPWADLLAATIADNGTPCGDVGLDIATAFKAVPYTVDWQIWIGISGTGAVEADVYLHGRDDEDQVWGRMGLLDGQVNGGVTITGTIVPSSPPVACDDISHYFNYQAIVAGFDRLYLQVLNLVGTATVVAKIRPIYICEPNGIA